MSLFEYAPTLLSLSILLFFITNAANNYNSKLIDSIENYFYDLRVQLSMPSTIDPRIVIVDLDEKSLEKLGRWPWHRDKVAQLTNQLFDHYSIKVLGFDVLFAEPDETSALQLLNDLPKHFDLDAGEVAHLDDMRQQWETDDVFAAALIARDIVLGYIFKETLAPEELGTLGKLPEPVLSRNALNDVSLYFHRAVGYSGNMELFQYATPYGGFFDYPSDAGFVRKAPLLQEYDGHLYESLALAVARLALGSPSVRLSFSDHEKLDSLTFEGVEMGDYFIPTDERGAVFVPFRGHQGSFPYVSAVDVIEGVADKALLENAIVLLGTTAPGLLDTRATPVGASYAGVEVHANIISGILDSSFKSKPIYVEGIQHILLGINALILIIFLPRLSPLTAVALAVFLLAGNVLLNVWFWWQVDLIVPIANILLLIFFIAFLELNYGYFVVSRDKRRLAGMFGYYVPQDIVKELDGQEAELSLAGEDREMTVLFSDVRNFTTISEGLPPTELTRMMNAFLTPITEAIHVERGTIDKYIGDAVMAFWGAPLLDQQHALNAVKAAMRMIEETHGLQEKFRAQGWPEIQLGVGISSGNMRVGNMGSEFRMAYTVLGDTVNLGARLEGLTKLYGVEIIVSETTAQMTPQIHYRELDRVIVKGKHEAVTLYQPIALQEDLEPAEASATADLAVALDAYRNQEWGLASRLFERLNGRIPDQICDLYVSRIAEYQQQRPATDWDGVYILTTK